MAQMSFAGCGMADLAREYGTPLYVMSEDAIRAKFASVRAAFDDAHERCSSHYAAKAFACRDMMRIVRSERAGLDVVSGGELALAFAHGIDPKVITFHGSSKTDAEISSGLDAGVGLFVCDNTDEIGVIASAARAKGTSADILIRVNTGTESDTHAHIATAAGSKFGVDASMLTDTVREHLSTDGVRIRGYHIHVGSQLMEPSSHLAGLDALLAASDEASRETGFVPSVLDLGGGFGVAYVDTDRPSEIADFLGPMVARIERHFANRGERRPDLIIEPGRYIVAEAGITLYTVCSIKRDPSGRLWVGVDGGYPDNVRPEMYGAKYRAVAANRHGEPADARCTIAGKCCESGDIVIDDIYLPEPRRGDIIAVCTTGAYCMAMANNYNMNPRPALVMIKAGVARLSIRRQTFDEMTAGQL